MNIITPQDIKLVKVIPQRILDIVNAHLKEHYKGEALVVPVPDISKRLSQEDRGKTFDKGWFDFEDVYNANGWNCEFVKTPYYASYDYWIFSQKK
jgi:hypothetical protein